MPPERAPAFRARIIITSKSYRQRAFHARFGKNAASDGDHHAGYAYSVGVMPNTTTDSAWLTPTVTLSHPRMVLDAPRQQSNSFRAWLRDERTSTKDGNVMGSAEDTTALITPSAHHLNQAATADPSAGGVGVLVDVTDEQNAKTDPKRLKINDLGPIVVRS